MQLTYVFAGAKTNNIRSLKAQEKLSYISLHVEKQFPDVHAALEKEVKSPCVLHVVSCEKFSNWLEVQNEGENMKGLKISLTIVVELAIIYLFQKWSAGHLWRAFSLAV